MLTDDEMHARMINGWRMGQPFTLCGNGSTLAATENVRRWLPEIVARYQIQTVCDAGAGDMAWIAHVKWDVAYAPFDLIPRSAFVAALDITRDRLPPCDLILCRMVLNHLDRERIVMALALFKQAGRYLAATQFRAEDCIDRARQFTRLDLRQYLGKPLEQIQDGNEAGCRLALWKLGG